MQKAWQEELKETLIEKENSIPYPIPLNYMNRKLKYCFNNYLTLTIFTKLEHVFFKVSTQFKWASNRKLLLKS